MRHNSTAHASKAYQRTQPVTSYPQLPVTSSSSSSGRAASLSQISFQPAWLANSCAHKKGHNAAAMSQANPSSTRDGRNYDINEVDIIQDDQGDMPDMSSQRQQHSHGDMLTPNKPTSTQLQHHGHTSSHSKQARPGTIKYRYQKFMRSLDADESRLQIALTPSTTAGRDPFHPRNKATSSADIDLLFDFNQFSVVSSPLLEQLQPYRLFLAGLRSHNGLSAASTASFSPSLAATEMHVEDANQHATIVQAEAGAAISQTPLIWVLFKRESIHKQLSGLVRVYQPILLPLTAAATASDHRIPTKPTTTATPLPPVTPTNGAGDKGPAHVSPTSVSLPLEGPALTVHTANTIKSSEKLATTTALQAPTHHATTLSCLQGVISNLLRAPENATVVSTMIKILSEYHTVNDYTDNSATSNTTTTTITTSNSVSKLLANVSYVMIATQLWEEVSGEEEA